MSPSFRENAMLWVDMELAAAGGICVKTKVFFRFEMPRNEQEDV